MKMSFEQLVNEANIPELPVDPISPDQMERIRILTMKQIQNSSKHRRNIRPMGLLIAAVLLITALCGTAVAAYENGWFGFDRIFGDKTQVVEAHIVPPEELENTEVTLPSYTEEEQQMIADGTMTVPEQAEVAETGARATTDDYQFTLEALLASPDMLYAVMRVDALTEQGKQALSEMEHLSESEGVEAFRFYALNNSGEGREKELKNGGLGMEVLQVEDEKAYFLLNNNGGQFTEGDPILFQGRANGINLDLFEVPLPHIMDTEATIQLEHAVYDDKGYCFESMTVTPISLVINGSYTSSPDQSTPDVTVTLIDGTSFDLASISNNFQHSSYGTYGDLAYSGTCGGPEDPFIKDSWVFSQVVELSEIDHITVDGVAYTLD